jgi:hypothetical protein
VHGILSPQDLQDLVDRCGEDPAAWPDDRRASAEELVDDCAEAQAIIVQARRLRAQLRDLGPTAPACLSERIVALALELDPPSDTFNQLPN